MNYFPFIDFVALQSHIHSVTLYTFWVVHGAPCQHRGHLRDKKGQDVSPEKPPTGPWANTRAAPRLPLHISRIKRHQRAFGSYTLRLLPCLLISRAHLGMFLLRLPELGGTGPPRPLPAPCLLPALTVLLGHPSSSACWLLHPRLTVALSKCSQSS